MSSPRSRPYRSPLRSNTFIGTISSEKPLSSSVERKWSLPTETTRWPLSLRRWCQLGTLPSYGSALSQKPIWWMYLPTANAARAGTQIGQVV